MEFGDFQRDGYLVDHGWLARDDDTLAERWQDSSNRAGNLWLHDDQMGREYLRCHTERCLFARDRERERAKGFPDNLMQIVKVEPLAGTNVVLRGSVRRRVEYNIDGFDMGLTAFDWPDRARVWTPHYLLNHRREVAGSRASRKFVLPE